VHSTRYCKCHYLDGQSEHWGLLERKPFAQKGSKPHYGPNTSIFPIHLKLDLNFDWDRERVWGTTHYDLKVNAPDVLEIEFDAMRLEVSKVKVEGKPVDFENTGEKLLISLKTPLKTGKKVSVVIEHSVEKPLAGIYFTKPDSDYPDRFKTVWTQGQDEDSRYYFPCFDQPNFKQTTEVILRLPTGMFGLANGKLLKKKLNGKESFFHYKLELPYSTYLLSIVGGDFAEHSEMVKGTNIKWHVEKGREKEAKNSFQETGKIISFFSDFVGYQYPYPHYTQIAVPEFIFGGMENFTVTTQTDLTLHDDRAHLDIDSNGLVAHEAAHMWFGDVVTAKTWSHAWLHESFATYFDALYTRESKGEDEFRYQMYEDAEMYFGEDSSYRRPIVTNVYKEPIDLFDAHLYPGGAVRLRHLMASLGEAEFRKVLKLYLKRHEFGLVETVDLLRCIEEVTSKNYDEWAAQWIFRGGYPILEIGFHWDNTHKIATVTIKQNQKSENKDDELLFLLSTKLRFYYGKTEETFPVFLDNKENKFSFRLKNKPLFLRLDPDFEIPCKKIKLDLQRPMLSEQLKKDPDPIGRLEAASALVEKPSTEEIKLLSERLNKEKFWGVSIRIASALKRIGGDLARDGLLKGVKHDCPKVRYGVASALGGFTRDEKVSKALRQLAVGDPSYRVEAAALRALGRIKSHDSREFLEKTLDRKTYNDMARIAIYAALAELEDQDSWDVFEKGAEYGSPKLSRSQAMKGLAALAKRFESKKGRALELLARFARETRGTPAAIFRGKLGAIQALQGLDDLAAIPILRKLSDNEPDGRLQRRAEDAISALRSSAKKPKEISEMRSELDDVLKENKSFRDRLDKIERTKEAKSKK
jgi:aminopeptidase N